MKWIVYILIILVCLSLANCRSVFAENGADGPLRMSKTFRIYDNDDACPPNCVCTSDGMVNCSRLGLTKIPKLPTSVVKIDFSYNHFATIPNDAFSGLSHLISIDLSGNMLSDVSIKERSFHNATKLQTLYLDVNSFSRIPEYLPRNITSLYFYGCKIKNVSSSYLAKYSMLSYLMLSQNHINFLPQNLTKLFPSLISLDVSFNNITEIHKTTFQGTSKIQELSLRFNKLTKIPTNFPSTLQHLDLVGNPYVVIPRYAFSNLRKLQTLELWESGARTIEDGAFTGLRQLTILDMMECHVTSAITNQTFRGLESVKTIDLSLSKIPSMEAGALNGLVKLETLWLNDNPFRTLDPLLFDHNTIPSISQIYLWGNNWVCDCKLKWLKEMQEKGDVIQDPHLMTCAEPKSLAGKAWDTLTAEQFVC